MEALFETDAERTKPLPSEAREGAIFDTSHNLQDFPLPDEHVTILFDPAEEAAPAEAVGVDALGGTTRGAAGGMGAAGGANRPAQIHAWGEDSEREAAAAPDTLGAPVDKGTFELPNAYRLPHCDLLRVRHEDLTREMLMEAPYPFIIDGLTSNWSALAAWEHDTLVKNHGDAPYHLHADSNASLGSLLRTNYKYWMGHAVYPRKGCYSDPWRPYSPFLFDAVGADYHVPPYFKPMSTFQMGVGRGAGVGVPPENHPSSWFAAVVGAKRWLLHPDTEREPPELMQRHTEQGPCMLDPATKSATTLECTQKPGDVIWVPNYWWHETCGLDPYSIGLGGITCAPRALGPRALGPAPLRLPPPAAFPPLTCQVQGVLRGPEQPGWPVHRVGRGEWLRSRRHTALPAAPLREPLVGGGGSEPVAGRRRGAEAGRGALGVGARVGP